MKKLVPSFQHKKGHKTKQTIKHMLKESSYKITNKNLIIKITNIN